MANHPSALKRDRQRRRRQTSNRGVRSVVRSLLADARTALGTAGGADAVKKASSAMAKAAQKGAMNKRAASRKIGRLARALLKAQAAAAAPTVERASKSPKARASRTPKTRAGKPAASKTKKTT